MSDTHFDSALDYLVKSGIDPEAIASGSDVEANDWEGGPLASKAPALTVVRAEDEDEDTDAEYSDVMSVSDQFDRYPDHCSVGPPEASVYNLSVPEDLEAWNTLQGKMIQAGTRAGNLLIQNSTNFHNGSYYVLASVRKVKFERLIP